MGLFHKHKYRLISAKDVTGTTYDFPYPPTKYHATKVLLKCDGCGKVKSDRYSGHHAEALLKNYEEKK